MCSNNGLFLIWIIVWIVLSYCFWHVSQPSVLQFWYLCSSKWIVFIFLFLDKEGLHSGRAFLLLLNMLLYCLPILGLVISFLLKSAVLINWPLRPITVQEWPIDHVWSSNLKFLLKCRFAGPGIFWHILKSKNHCPKHKSVPKPIRFWDLVT